MTKKLGYWLIAAFLLTTPPTWAQANTPEGALEEMATATTPEAILKHLPAGVKKRVNELPREERANILENLNIARQMEKEGKQLRRSADGSAWEVVAADGKTEVTIAIKSAFLSGQEALVPLEVKQGDRTHVFLVKLRLEDGDWQITEAGTWEGRQLETELAATPPSREDQHGSAATSTLRTINTALVTYATTYPDIGYPVSLAELSGLEDQEPSPQHAMLLEPAFLSNPGIKSGYEFRYTRIERGDAKSESYGGYQATATPVQLGTNGLRSFFTDETAVIRATSEPRPATANDPPLD